uniref:Uncharacterized protein n=1 Tax=Timema cristinae TaxID=61476 RepID=A0A7R9CRV8_TIMCR|nr:unnamed protein product [Timema cristinae]
MGSKVEYVESSHIYATNYIRNSKAIGVLWGIFTICYAIIGVVAFVTPEWIGETLEAEYPGRFGLWARCYFRTASEVSGGAEDCRGSLDDLGSIPSAAFKAATIFVGLSVVLSFLAICSMLLFFFFQSTTVFHICGWVQVLSVKRSADSGGVGETHTSLLSRCGPSTVGELSAVSQHQRSQEMLIFQVVPGHFTLFGCNEELTYYLYKIQQTAWQLFSGTTCFYYVQYIFLKLNVSTSVAIPKFMKKIQKSLYGTVRFTVPAT